MLNPDLPLADPRPAAHWRAHNAERIALLRPEARPPFTEFERRAWEVEGLHVVIVPPLIRTDEQQFELFKSGRELRNGEWVLVDPSKWKTNARDASKTPHGKRIRAASDWGFLSPELRLLGTGPGVIDAWHASHPWERFGRLGEACGLTWGGRFKRRDLDHLETPSWKDLPLLSA